MSWYDKYMINAVSIETLNKLVKNQIITQSEVDKMVADRLEHFGY